MFVAPGLRYLDTVRQHHAKTRFAAHHLLVGFRSAFERIRLDHRPHAVEHAKGKSILRVDGATRRPATDRTPPPDQQPPRYYDRLVRVAYEDQLAVDGDSSEHRIHGFAVRDGREDYLGSSQFLEFRNHIL